MKGKSESTLGWPVVGKPMKQEQRQEILQAIPPLRGAECLGFRLRAEGLRVMASLSKFLPAPQKEPADRHTVALTLGI